MNIPRGGYPMAARLGVLTAAGGTTAVALLLPMSSAARVMGNSVLAEIMVWMTLAAVLLGVADLIMHDIFGRLIMPSIDTHVRHRACVWIYHFLAGSWLIRSLVIIGSQSGQPIERMVLGSWYVATGVSVGVVAVLMALDDR